MASNANGSDGNRKAVLITLLRRRSTVLKPDLSLVVPIKKPGILKELLKVSTFFHTCGMFYIPLLFTLNNVLFATTPWYHDRESSLRKLAGLPTLPIPDPFGSHTPNTRTSMYCIIYPILLLIHGRIVNQTLSLRRRYFRLTPSAPTPRC